MWIMGLRYEYIWIHMSLIFVPGKSINNDT